MEKHIIASRGHSKPCLQYFHTIDELYRKNIINKAEYLVEIGIARQVLLNESEEKIIKWIEEQLKD